MIYGLPETDMQKILDVFKRFPKVGRVVLFGSRAKGEQRPGSDIDIAVYGGHLVFDDLLQLRMAMEDLGMLYKIDIVLFDTIKTPELLKHIERSGIVVYEKPQVP